MDGTVGIVLEKTSVLADLCGANDYNLRVMERLVGSRIFCRGNELFLDTEDESARELFRLLVEAPHRVHGRGPGAHPRPHHSDTRRPHARGRDLGDLPAATAVAATSWIPASRFPAASPRSFRGASPSPSTSRASPPTILSFAVGPAGTGKTYLAMAWALRELLTKSKRKLILTRPVVEAGESLGFLPGDLAQKISPYLRPLYDAMEALVPFETVRRLEESRAIEIAPLAYMRGRNLSNCVVILDEAQNTTKEQMKMFLTRLGENYEGDRHRRRHADRPAPQGRVGARARPPAPLPRRGDIRLPPRLPRRRPIGPRAAHHRSV